MNSHKLLVVVQDEGLQGPLQALRDWRRALGVPCELRIGGIPERAPERTELFLVGWGEQSLARLGVPTGHLPTRDPERAAAYLRKLLRYERGLDPKGRPVPGAVLGRTLLVAEELARPLALTKGSEPAAGRFVVGPSSTLLVLDEPRPGQVLRALVSNNEVPELPFEGEGSGWHFVTDATPEAWKSEKPTRFVRVWGPSNVRDPVRYSFAPGGPDPGVLAMCELLRRHPELGEAPRLVRDLGSLPRALRAAPTRRLSPELLRAAWRQGLHRLVLFGPPPESLDPQRLGGAPLLPPVVFTQASPPRGWAKAMVLHESGPVAVFPLGDRLQDTEARPGHHGHQAVLGVPDLSVRLQPWVAATSRLERRDHRLVVQLTSGQGQAIVGARVHPRDRPESARTTDLRGQVELELESADRHLQLSGAGLRPRVVPIEDEGPTRLAVNAPRPLHVLVELRLEPQALESAAALLRAAAEASRRAPGCLSYEVLQGQVDPCITCIHEAWESAAHFDANVRSEHVQRLNSALPPLLARPASVRTFHPLR